MATDVPLPDRACPQRPARPRPVAATRASVLVALFLCVQAAAGAVPTRTPVAIPMRDVHPVTMEQVTLAADLYRPDGVAAPLPVVLIQTPYNKNRLAAEFLDPDQEDPLLASPDYAFVVADWRGFGTSGSQDMIYEGAPSRGEDGHDVVQWIAAQSWCSGVVGTWGASALGNVQMKTAAERPAALRACVPIVYHFREWYDLSFPGGVDHKNRNDFVFLYFGGTSLQRAHPTYDLFWQLAEAVGDVGDIDVPVLHISGWYDHETTQTIREFRAMQDGGGEGARGRQWLLVGPWSHGAIGDGLQQAASYPAAAHESSREALAFFDRHLRGLENGWERRPPVRWFQTNEDRWRTASDWPPPSPGELRLHPWPDATLRAEPPATSATLTLASDPAAPAPSLGGALLEVLPGDIQGPVDLRPLDGRDDVVLFDTGPLDAPLRLAGEGSVRARIACSAVDADLNVRLAQVWPDGRAIWLADGVRRASLRDGFTTRQLLTPGVAVEVEAMLPPLAVTIPAGHGLRLYIAASNYPRFDVNPHDGSPLSTSPGVVLTPATISLELDPAGATVLRLPLAPPPVSGGVVVR